MIGRLVEQQNIGLGRKHAGERGATRLAAGKMRRVFLAGKAKLIQKGSGAIGIVGRPEPRLDIGEASWESRRNPAPAADSAHWRRAA